MHDPIAYTYFERDLTEEEIDLALSLRDVDHPYRFNLCQKIGDIAAPDFPRYRFFSAALFDEFWENTFSEVFEKAAA